MMISQSSSFGLCRASNVSPGCPLHARSIPLSHQARRSVIRRLGRDETAEKALERRQRESARVDERVRFIYDEEDWQREQKEAGNNLIVLEIQGESVCDSGMEEQAELHWKIDSEAARLAALQQCTDIKHTFQRIARDCNDATFLSLSVGDEPTPSSSALVETLGVDLLPTLQFWRGGAKLWEHRGAMDMGSDLAEGVLFYEGSAANGVRIQDYVLELDTRAGLETFVKGGGADDHVLKVVNVALTSATPCIHIFPAILALAKNFKGFASFARIMGDNSRECAQILQEFKIVEVPTFLFFRDGKEIGRHVGSSRADLIGKILETQQALGITPPPAPGKGRPVPKRERASWR